jgi:hypothetical protein
MRAKHSLLLLAVVFFLCTQRVEAAEQPLFNLGGQYSIDLITTREHPSAGDSVQVEKVNFHDGKLRIELSRMPCIFIYRPDLKKNYRVYDVDRKLYMAPLNLKEYQAVLAPIVPPPGKLEVVGAETVEGVACTKYKLTRDEDKKVCLYWIDATTQLPVKMQVAGEDEFVTFKDYRATMQQAALFEPPIGYTPTNRPIGK